MSGSQCEFRDVQGAGEHADLWGAVGERRRVGDKGSTHMCGGQWEHAYV